MLAVKEGEKNNTLHPQNIVDAYQKHTIGKQCITFARDVKHSIDIAAAYNEAGISAIHLDGKSKKREQPLIDFESKKYQVIVNCGLFIEGLDITNIEVVQIAKNTKSLSAYLQMLGRGLRPAPNKDHTVFLDHTDNHLIHGHPSDPRIWTLDGVIKNPGKGTKEIKDDDLDLDIEPESDIDAKPVELVDVTTGRTLIDMNMSEMRRLVDRAEKMGKLPRYVYDSIIKLKPPLEVWYQYAKLCKDSPSWAEKVHEALGNGTIYKVRPPKMIMEKPKKQQYSRY